MSAAVGSIKEMQDIREQTGDAGSAEREQDAESEGLRFDDPYWDDAFCAWWDPALRTCCG